eukprot:6490258-Amphidinium_carterae.2
MAEERCHSCSFRCLGSQLECIVAEHYCCNVPMSAWDLVAAVGISSRSVGEQQHSSDASWGLVAAAGSSRDCNASSSWDQVAALDEGEQQRTQQGAEVVAPAALAADALGAVATDKPPQRRKRGRPPKHACPRSTDLALGGVSVVAVADDPNVYSQVEPIILPKIPPNLACATTMMVQTPTDWNVCPDGGYMVMSKLGVCLWHCIGMALGQEINHDDDYMQLLEHFLHNDDYHCASALIKSRFLNMSRQVLQEKMWRFASALCHWQRVSRFVFEQEVLSAIGPLGKVLAYVDAVCYDETPMKTSIQADVPKSVPLNAAATASSPMLDATLVGKLDDKVSSTSVVCKILQFHQAMGILVEVNGRMVHFISDTVTPLQVMERANASVLQQCLLRQCAVSKASEQAQVQTRISCTDKGAYNLKCERDISNLRGSWQHMGVHCDIHATSNAHHRTFEHLLPDQVVGLLHVALSVQLGSALSCFRSCLKTEIRQRLKVYRGHASAEARSHRAAILDLFMSDKGSTTQIQRLLMSKLPNGNWRNEKDVEFYIECEDGPTPDADRISSLLESGLTYAMMAAKFKVWPRHRWTGAALSIDLVSRMEACHRLLSHTYCRFVVVMSKPSNRVFTQPTAGLASDSGAPTLENVGLAEVNNSGNADASADVEMDNAGLVGNEDVQGMAEGTGNTAADNSKQRSKGMKWLQTKPFDFLVLLRHAVEPLTIFMQEQLHLCSWDWEIEQRSKVAQALASGQEGIGLRAYMCTVAAEGMLEKKLFSSIGQLYMSENIWSVIHEEHFTVQFRCLAFRVFSREAATVYELVARCHQRYPYRMFLCLSQPEMAPTLLRDPLCCLDSWSKQIRETHPSLSGRAFHQCLIAHALCIKSNIAPVEAKHASIRRQLQSKVQTWPQQFRTCSAEWVFQCLRQRSLRMKWSDGCKSRVVRRVKKKVCQEHRKMCLFSEMICLKPHSLNSQVCGP